MIDGLLEGAGDVHVRDVVEADVAVADLNEAEVALVALALLGSAPSAHEDRMPALSVQTTPVPPRPCTSGSRADRSRRRGRVLQEGAALLIGQSPWPS